jgi:hypothetical protein
MFWQRIVLFIYRDGEGLQGDQNLTLFASRAIVYYGPFLKITEVTHSIGQLFTTENVL